ncbi:hypothetical protein [Flavobacterium sp. GSA192]|uniref:hypothetical protein n=1 Tax=Flavobacterium sp. GSA192 TaxID=2576304 RepID=UPI00112806F8|nr:hypothetical protein [Flavobacterium sp. GSA192]
MKIALVEDRIGRMNQFIDIDIKSIENIQIITETDLSDLKIDLDQGITIKLDMFDCLIFHRSALTNTQREIIKTYCKTNKKALVFFSGGISSSFYNDSTFPYLLINSKDLYSNNLKMFSDHSNQHNIINLLILQYGAKWKTNQLLLIKENLNLRFQLKTIKRITDLKIPKNQIKDFDLDWLDKGDFLEINEDQIKQFKLTLDKLIYDSI